MSGNGRTNGAGETRVGILYPGYAAEDDFQLAETLIGDGARFPVVHTTIGEDLHTVEALLETGRPERLAAGAEALRALDVHAVVWACTSGSFVFGLEGARRQAEQVAEVAGVPATSTSLAFVSELRRLGLRSVAIAATYPMELASHFRSFLEAADIEVVRLEAAGIMTAEAVGDLGENALLGLVKEHDHEDAEAILVPDTALHTLAELPDVEEAIGKPVLTANQVSVLEGLRLAESAAGRR